jgi:hypothetical protein
MKTYDVTIGFYVSQVIEVEADDYESAMEKAFEQGFDTPNASNNFEMDGDPSVILVSTNGTVVYEPT